MDWMSYVHFVFSPPLLSVRTLTYVVVLPVQVAAATVRTSTLAQTGLTSMVQSASANPAGADRPAVNTMAVCGERAPTEPRASAAQTRTLACAPEVFRASTAPQVSYKESFECVCVCVCVCVVACLIIIDCVGVCRYR
jgi:hypothetical protein